jgi:hypothetical protein
MSHAGAIVTFPKTPPRIVLPPVRPPPYSGAFPDRITIPTPTAAFELTVLALGDEDIIAVDDSDERITLVPER